MVVETVSEAKRVFKILMDNVGDADRPVYHAVDTEVSHIDVSDQCPVGHGRVTCFSVYCGPDVDFGAGATRAKKSNVQGIKAGRLKIEQAQDAAVG
jgi:DNA polymerase-1